MLLKEKNPDVVYAGTSNMLFKSTDKGVSWATIYPTPSDIVAIHAQGDHAEENIITVDSTVTVIESLAVDPLVPQRLISYWYEKEKNDLWPPFRDRIRVYYMAIMVSEDGGDHWEILDKIRFDLDQIFLIPLRL